MFIRFLPNGFIRFFDFSEFGNFMADSFSYGLACIWIISPFFDSITFIYSGLKMEKLCNKELLDKCEMGNTIAPLRHKC